MGAESTEDNKKGTDTAGKKLPRELASSDQSMQACNPSISCLHLSCEGASYLLHGPKRQLFPSWLGFVPWPPECKSKTVPTNPGCFPMKLHSSRQTSFQVRKVISQSELPKDRLD